MKLVLMCGGIGKRMSPITTDKSLLLFCGKPLVVHQIESARKAGIDQFVIIANPANIDDLKAALSRFDNLKIDFALQSEPSGMADALLRAAAFLTNTPFVLVSSNDTFDTAAYSELLGAYKNNSGYISYITARQVTEYFPGGYLVINSNNEVTKIIEKPDRGKEPSDLINIVLHLHTDSDKLLGYLSRTTSASDDIYEKAIDQMINDGNKIKAVKYKGLWQAIKYPWHILDTMDFYSNEIKRKIASSVRVSEKATIDGSVIIEDNVNVHEGAVIRGPSYIGRDSVIGNNALIRNSIIGSRCVIGYNTEIKHSYIGNNCWFHSNYIGDSVIEDNCSFGAGAVTANYRLDEERITVKIGNEKIDTGFDKLGAIVARGCRLGINANIMPGIRVGANSFVGAHVCLTSDLDSNKMAVSEAQYRVLPNKIGYTEDKRQELLRKLKG
jgi:UDP-N-acetylglucosamine diphosphorylase / glucose-1-phosphate thymidylyltransferase / UDP-N-acetylgalactosamine diphosphorylase / glucosamine-1-phosphate N-acetyltransferase / galactosamine-1-phosphate N-acetyltransferase